MPEAGSAGEVRIVGLQSELIHVTQHGAHVARFRQIGLVERVHVALEVGEARIREIGLRPVACEGRWERVLVQIRLFLCFLVLRERGQGGRQSQCSIGL